MIALRRNVLVLAAGVLTCAALGYFFHAARLRGADLREHIATLRQTSETEPVRPATMAAVPSAEASTAEQRELAEWTALLEAARRIPELARREAALRVVRRIQTDHTENPPAPRPVPPPEPKNAMFFAELLDDPEYLQLVAQQWRMGQGGVSEHRLAQLRVPDAVRNKVVELEFDSYAAMLEVERHGRHEETERGAARAASQALRAENDAAIRQLLGEEAFAAYRDRTPPATVEARLSDSVFNPLVRRLSYSAAPLDPATHTQLAELLRSMSSSPGEMYALPRTPTFIDRARSVLQPAQIAALEELRVEYEAARARSRLPKSSELPRTTRRQRLEAGSN